MEFRLAGLEEESIVDGPGIRFVVFVQGCHTHCPGCQNSQTWDPEGGEAADTDEILAKFRANPLLRGITFSGGEPFLQPCPLLHMAKAVHAMGKTVMSYSGYTLEHLVSLCDSDVDALLGELDMLVDGPYIESERNLELAFRGSENQRVLKREDIAQALAARA